MGLKIKLTENELRNFVRKVVNKKLFEDINMDQYSEFNYDELAQHLEQDLKEYGIIYVGQTNGMDQITLEFPNEWYITLEFNFNDDGSLYYVYIETDETDKDIIRLTGTPYHEIYRLGEGDEFDYDTLLEYVKEILDRHNNAIATLGKKQNENLTRRVTERVLKKLNESDGNGYDGDSVNTDFNLIAKALANEIEKVMDKEGTHTVYAELIFRDKSSIDAEVEITVYSNETYYWGGDYYSPPESSGYNEITIDGEPIVNVYDSDGTQWDDEDVEKLNIDWSPLDKVADEIFEW